MREKFEVTVGVRAREGGGDDEEEEEEEEEVGK